MSDQEKFQRMLQLLLALSHPEGMAIDEAVNQLGISARSVYRYISTFKAAGFVVDKQGPYYRLVTHGPDYGDLQELVYFSQEDAALLSQLIHELQHDHQRRQQLANKLRALFDSENVAAQLVPRRSMRQVKDLYRAMTEQVQIVLRNYRRNGQPHGEDTEVEAFAFSDDMKSIWAFEISTRSNRPFRISRIGEVLFLTTEWQYSHLHQQGTHDAFGGQTNAQLLPIRFDMNAQARERLHYFYPLAEKYLTRLSGGRFRFEGPVANYERVGEFLLSQAGHVSNIHPEELRNYLSKKARLLIS